MKQYKKLYLLYNPEIHKTGRVDFDMGRTVSEGYKKGGKEYFETSTVRAGFDKKKERFIVYSELNNNLVKINEKNNNK